MLYFKKNFASKKYQFKQKMLTQVDKALKKGMQILHWMEKKFTLKENFFLLLDPDWHYNVF